MNSLFLVALWAKWDYNTDMAAQKAPLPGPAASGMFLQGLKWPRKAAIMFLVQSTSDAEKPAIKNRQATHQDRMTREFRDLVKSEYRFAALDTMTVSINDATPGVEQDRWKEKIFYSRNCWTRVLNTKTHFSVPSNWKKSVQMRGLAVVNGMVTVCARKRKLSLHVKINVVVGCELFAAKWIVQGRGSNLRNEAGFIARSGNVAHHAETAEKAISGLRRKIKASGDAAKAKAVIAAAQDAAQNAVAA